MDRPSPSTLTEVEPTQGIEKVTATAVGLLEPE